MADHQRDASAARCRDDGAALLHRRSNRLLDQHVDAARGAGGGNVAMQLRRRRDGDRVDAVTHQSLGVVEGGAAERAGDEFAALAIGISDANQLDAGQLGKHASVVRAHDADADNADTQRAVPVHFLRLTHDPKRPLLPRADPTEPP
jgi:hypothetical protein